MMEPSSPPIEPPPRAKRWQVGLRSLVLLMGAVAVWLAVFVNRREYARLETRIRAMQPLAHELKIDDARQFAVVKLDELWMDDDRWDLYLPPGEYRVCLATREVPKTGLVTPKQTATLKGGRHRLELHFDRMGEGWRIRVATDDAKLMTLDETKEWGESGSSTGGGGFSLSTQLPADKPLELYRRRYHAKTSPTTSAEPAGPADGLLLWIEPVKGPKP